MAAAAKAAQRQKATAATMASLSHHLSCVSCAQFVDKVDPKSGKTYKDRVGLIVLLKHCSGRQLVFVSTHLHATPRTPNRQSHAPSRPRSS